MVVGVVFLFWVGDVGGLGCASLFLMSGVIACDLYTVNDVASCSCFSPEVVNDSFVCRGSFDAISFSLVLFVLSLIHI